jgi:glycosyltransferase involved in cell wall biosynthesis
MEAREPHLVSLFLPFLASGGAERVTLNVARGLVMRGMEVDLVLSSAGGPFYSMIPEGVRVVDLGARRVLTSLPALVRYLQRRKPEAMLSALDHANLVAIWARSLARSTTRLVVAVHSTMSRSTRLALNRRDRLIPILANRFYRKADGIVVISEAAANDLSAQTGIPREDIEVIYNPVLHDGLFEMATQPVDHPWFELPGTRVIVSVGRLTRAKNYPLLLRAFDRVRKEANTKLVILGEGELRPDLERQIRSHGLEEYVSMPGFVENPYPYMKRAHLLVLSSIWEGLPTVLVEALALGTPRPRTKMPWPRRFWRVCMILYRHRKERDSRRSR